MIAPTSISFLEIFYGIYKPVLYEKRYGLIIRLTIQKFRPEFEFMNNLLGME